MTRKNKIYNHQLLINLKSAFEGKFAELNILSQLGTNKDLRDEIEHTQILIKRINKWQKNLEKGIIVYGDDTANLDLEASKTCFQLFKYLRKELDEKAFVIKKIQSSSEPHTPYEEVVELIANLSRYVYCIESFLIEQKEFRINFSDDGNKSTSDLDQLINDYKNMMSVIDEFIVATKNIKDQGQRFYDLLKYHSRLIAGYYRAHSHECLVLMNGSNPLLSFKDSGFLKGEAIEWEKFNFSAQEAGYWRAYEISPKEAREWCDLGFFNALNAASWVTSGFTPFSAKPWIDVLFTPILALHWALAEYSSKEASLFVRKGIHSPDMIPDNNEQVENILAESLEEHLADMKAIKEKNTGRRRTVGNYKEF